jgi:aminoglycoside 2'-N-acetyltransferase I
MGVSRMVGETVDVRVCSFPEASLPLGYRNQVLAARAEAWPTAEPPSGSAAWPTHDPALRPISMVLLAGDTVLAALDILTRPIQHAGESYLAGGLSTVVTPRAAQRRGHGLQLVTAARAAMAAGDWDLGLFTCDRPLQRFYEGAGWHLLPGAVLVGGTAAAPFASDRPGFDKVTMADFFSEHGRLHRAAFPDSRIAIHSGEIDRLW